MIIRTQHITMKRWKAGLLLLLFMCSTVINTATLLRFVKDQDIIANTLCVQKDMQLGCNGKCYLSKMLAETSKDSKEQQLPGFLELNLLFWNTEDGTFNELLSTDLFLKKSVTTVYSNPFFQNCYLNIDTPPPDFS